MQNGFKAINEKINRMEKNRCRWEKKGRKGE